MATVRVVAQLKAISSDTSLSILRDDCDRRRFRGDETLTSNDDLLDKNWNISLRGLTTSAKRKETVDGLQPLWRHEASAVAEGVTTAVCLQNPFEVGNGRVCGIKAAAASTAKFGALLSSSGQSWTSRSDTIRTSLVGVRQQQPQQGLPLSRIDVSVLSKLGTSADRAVPDRKVFSGGVTPRPRLLQQGPVDSTPGSVGVDEEEIVAQAIKRLRFVSSPAVPKYSRTVWDPEYDGFRGRASKHGRGSCCCRQFSWEIDHDSGRSLVRGSERDGISDCDSHGGDYTRFRTAEPGRGWERREGNDLLMEVRKRCVRLCT